MVLVFLGCFISIQVYLCHIQNCKMSSYFSFVLIYISQAMYLLWRYVAHVRKLSQTEDNSLPSRINSLFAKTMNCLLIPLSSSNKLNSSHLHFCYPLVPSPPRSVPFPANAFTRYYNFKSFRPPSTSCISL